jgi:hypothetical protein
MPATARAGTNPYPHSHRVTRANLIRAALGTPCPGALVNGQPWYSDHCDGIMTDAKRMHLDHTTAVADGGTRGDRICCSPCNTGAGAVMGNQRRTPTERRRTRVW